MVLGSIAACYSWRSSPALGSDGTIYLGCYTGLQAYGSAPVITPSAGENGAIDPSLFAQPVAGYIVDTWYLDGVDQQQDDTSFTLDDVTADHTVTVSFTPGFTVTGLAGANGCIGPDGAQTVVSGESITFFASPNDGYAVNTWSVDGMVDATQTGASEYVLSNVSADHTVSVTFTTGLTVTGVAGNNGCIAPDGAQTVLSTGSITFSATPDLGYAVANWSVDGVIDATQAGAAEYLLSNVTANHTVSVSFTPGLIVTGSAGEYGAIDPEGPQSIASGSDAFFSATPDDGYVVNNWLVDGTIDTTQAGATSYDLADVMSNHTVSVTFTPGLIVTGSAGANGSIDPDGDQSVASGADITFYATPDDGYQVNNWSVDGVVDETQSSAAEYTLSDVTANHTVSVTFSLGLIVTGQAGLNGSISPDGDQIVSSGDDITFDAMPDDGYVVNSWSVDGVLDSTQTGASEYTLANVTANHVVSVTFMPGLVVIGEAGANGSINPDGAQTVASGDDITFTALPDDGYVVNNWSVDGVVDTTQAGASQYTLSAVTANHTVSVTFTPGLIVTGQAGANGQISPDGDQTVASGGSATFSANPDFGYAVNTWSVDGVVDSTQTGSSQYTLSDVIANHTVAVTFTPGLIVTGVAGDNGAIDPNGAQTVASGTAITFTASPNDGYVVDSWAVDGVVDATQAGSANYVLSDVSANHTVTVTFTPGLIVTGMALANGAIDPTGAQTVAYGGSVIFSATPDNGYLVNTWFVDGVVDDTQSGSPEYVLSNVTASHTVSVTFTSGLLVYAQAGANGAIDPDGDQNIASGDSITFSAYPNDGYVVANWSVDGVIDPTQAGATQYVLSDVLTNHSVTVSFMTGWAIYGQAGANGFIDPDGAVTVPNNGSITFSATPDDGYAVNQWSVDGVIDPTQNGASQYELTDVSANHFVSVSFSYTGAISDYNIVIPAIASTPSTTEVINGTITPSIATAVSINGSITFTATPTIGYDVYGWYLDNSTTAIDLGQTSFTLSNVISDHTVTVSFVEKLKVTVKVLGDNGTITPNLPQIVSYNGNVTFIASPEANCKVYQWSIKRGLITTIVQSGGNSFTLTNIKSDTLVEVSFIAVATAEKLQISFNDTTPIYQYTGNPINYVSMKIELSISQYNNTFDTVTPASWIIQILDYDGNPVKSIKFQSIKGSLDSIKNITITLPSKCDEYEYTARILKNPGGTSPLNSINPTDAYVCTIMGYTHLIARNTHSWIQVDTDPNSNVVSLTGIINPQPTDLAQSNVIWYCSNSKKPVGTGYIQHIPVKYSDINPSIYNNDPEKVATLMPTKNYIYCGGLTLSIGVFPANGASCSLTNPTVQSVTNYIVKGLNIILEKLVAPRLYGIVISVNPPPSFVAKFSEYWLEQPKYSIDPYGGDYRFCKCAWNFNGSLSGGVDVNIPIDLSTILKKCKVPQKIIEFIKKYSDGAAITIDINGSANFDVQVYIPEAKQQPVINGESPLHFGISLSAKAAILSSDIISGSVGVTAGETVTPSFSCALGSPSIINANFNYSWDDQIFNYSYKTPIPSLNKTGSYTFLKHGGTRSKSVQIWP